MASDYSLKRKCSPFEEKQPKRQLLEDLVGILHLSDCILLEILKHLNATDLYHLGITCRRFSYLVRDHSLWIDVDARSSPNNTEKIAFVWENVGAKTKNLRLAAIKRTEFILSTKVLANSGTSLNLTVLALEHQCIKYSRLNEFPTSLQELSFRHSYIPRHTVFFRFSETQMRNLKTLILDHCQWLQADIFTSIGKYPCLEILSLYMCKKFVEDEIAYVSLAGRCGFPSLKVADLRFTGFGDLFIKSFHSKPLLQIIYFQCFTSTYQMERYERKLNIIHGAKMEEHSYVSDDEDNNDTSRESLKMRFNATTLQEYNTQTVTDGTMIFLTRLKKTHGSKLRPSSVLYKYPYQSCTCGHQSIKQKESSNINPLWDEEALKDKLQNEINKQKINRLNRCDGHILFLCPNNWCYVEATKESPIQNWLYTREARNDYEVSMLEHTDKHFQFRVSRRCTFDQGCNCTGRSSQDDNPIVISGPQTAFLHIQDILPHPATIDNHFPGLTADLIAECIIKIKSRNYPRLEIQALVYSFLKQFTRHYKINSDVLQDEKFLGEIYSIFYELSDSITFDVHHVLRYHTTCIDDLVKCVVFQNKPKEFLKTFFSNLLYNESSGSNRFVCLNVPGPSGSNDESISNASQEIPENESRTLASIENIHRPVYVRRIFYNGPRDNANQAHRLASLLVVNNDDVPNEKFPTSIKELSLRGYHHVTDRTLLQIRDLELDLLDVTGTNVTEQALEQFLGYNPQCRVIHESACVCRPTLHF